MEKILTKALGLALIAAMLLSAIPAINATPPADNNAIWIEPSAGVNLSTAYDSIGDYFSIILWAKANVATGAWSFRLIFNKLMLENISCVYTGPSAGKSDFFANISTVPVSASVNEIGDGIHRRIDFGESWAGVGPKRDPGTGSLANITFQIKSVPNKGLNFDEEFDISTWDTAHQTQLNAKTWLIDPSLPSNANKIGIGVDADYTFIWSAPANAVLTVGPNPPTFNRFTHWIGTTFVMSVKLDVNAAWYITQANFTLNFNKNFLKINTAVINSAIWDITNLNTIDNVNGKLVVSVNTTGSVGGNLLVVTITFEITDQGTWPTIFTSTMTFTSVILYDHKQVISNGPNGTGTVVVEGYQAFHSPYLEVVPNTTTVGGGYVVGTTIDVTVDMKQLFPAWNLVGLEFRMTYDTEWLELMNVAEGPFLPDGPPPNATWFASYPDQYPPTHVLIGTLILPDIHGVWYPPFPGAALGQPGENGTLATFTFKIKKQLTWPNDHTVYLNLFGIKMISKDGTWIPYRDPINGTVEILGLITQGRNIDLYGGADNAGYGPFPDPFPAPYGGQGPNMPMDLVIPQSEVVLYANVTYNYWPVQQKDVGFEVEGPYLHLYNESSQTWYYELAQGNYSILLKETDRSDANGVASITFAMPWPCVDPESLLGVWKVTAAVNIRDVVVTDTLYFYYDYMVHIWKVTTDKFFYAHEETVQITIEYGSHSMQTYPALFCVTLKDELNVMAGMDLAGLEVGGAVFCTYANGTLVLHIKINKWAFSGYADIYVNCYDIDPTLGGFAWCPQWFEEDKIYILPL